MRSNRALPDPASPGAGPGAAAVALSCPLGPGVTLTFSPPACRDEPCHPAIPEFSADRTSLRFVQSHRPGGGHRVGRMVSLGRISAPKPINLPSQKREHGGLDPNVELVPKGSHVERPGQGGERAGPQTQDRRGGVDRRPAGPRAPPSHARSPDRSDSFPDLNGAARGGGSPGEDGRGDTYGRRDDRYDDGYHHGRRDDRYDDGYHHGRRDDRYHNGFDRDPHDGYHGGRRSFERDGGYGHDRDHRGYGPPDRRYHHHEDDRDGYGPPPPQPHGSSYRQYPGGSDGRGREPRAYARDPRDFEGYPRDPRDPRDPRAEMHERRHGHEIIERRRSFDPPPGPGSPGGPPPGPPPLPPGPPPAWATRAPNTGEDGKPVEPPRPTSPAARADRRSSNGAPGEWGSAANEADTSLPPVPSDDSRGASPAPPPHGPPPGQPSPSAQGGSPAAPPKNVRVLTRPSGHSPGKPLDDTGHFSSAKLPEHLRDLRLAPTGERKLWTPDGSGSGSNSRNNSVGERRAPVETVHKVVVARKGGDAGGGEGNGKDGKVKGAGPKNKKQGNKKAEAPKPKAAAAAAPAPPVNPPPPPGPPPPGTAKVAVPQPAPQPVANGSGPKGNKTSKANKTSKEAKEATAAIQASRSRRPRGRGRRERRTPRRLLVMGPRPPLRKTRVAVAPRVAAEVRHLSLRHHLSPERQSCPHRRLQRMRRDNM